MLSARRLNLSVASGDAGNVPTVAPRDRVRDVTVPAVTGLDFGDSTGEPETDAGELAGGDDFFGSTEDEGAGDDAAIESTESGAFASASTASEAVMAAAAFAFASTAAETTVAMADAGPCGSWCCFPGRGRMTCPMNELRAAARKLKRR